MEFSHFSNVILIFYSQSQPVITSATSKDGEFYIRYIIKILIFSDAMRHDDTSESFISSLYL